MHDRKSTRRQQPCGAWPQLLLISSLGSIQIGDHRPTVTGSSTTITLRTPQGEPLSWQAAEQFRDWTLIHAEGESRASSPWAFAGEPTTGARLQLTFPVAAPKPIRLEARKEAVPVTDSFTLTIPLR